MLNGAVCFEQEAEEERIGHLHGLRLYIATFLPSFLSLLSRLFLHLVTCFFPSLFFLSHGSLSIYLLSFPPSFFSLFPLTC